MHPFHRFMSERFCHPGRHAGHFMTRHGGRGFPGFGGRPGFFGDPSGGRFDGLGRGRKLSSGDLQLLLLALLADRPSHGYELIKALDERSKGYYAPSPGMVYPALTYLEEIGHCNVEAQGNKKLYSITEAGRAHLDEQRTAADALLDQLAAIGERMDEVRRAMSAAAEDADLPASRWAGRHGRGGPELRAARQALKAAMISALGEAGESAEEQRRIADILERAAQEIRTRQRSA